jgi:uncharacterized protein (TIGR03437 family)
MLKYFFIPLIALSLLTPAVFAQRNRIAGRIDNNRRVALTGHLHPKALPENDQGPVPAEMILSHVTLVLKPSTSQQADLDRLLQEQQDPSSADYHRWLTPQQYADRFGVSQDDLNQLTAWLQSQHLTIDTVATGRNWVAVSGAAADMQAAFRTPIHNFLVNGKTHFANTADPTIPAALQGVVLGIHGLNSFRLRPASRSAQPAYTSSTSGNHYLAPADFSLIYNIKPLYAAGFTGAGQKIAVAGQTAINLDDIRQFRTKYNLPANDPQIVVADGSPNPRLYSDELIEADLDLEWSGAVAPDATLLYVVFDQDVVSAVQYAIDKNLAPVISLSYGLCELETLPSDASTTRSLAQQANSQGITWFTASGDSGGTDCANGGSSRTSGLLSVDFPSSIPEVTGVGGTTFNEGSGNYWNSTNDANNASVVSYIPETSWNDSTPGNPGASGGGASAFFTKPSWQTGTGVPSDGARDVPDVSLAASADHDGYLVYSAGSLSVVGGTSAGAPAFAGIASLLNQYLIAAGQQSIAGLGNVNPRLYSLAQSSPAAFHDVTTGSNIINVTCGFRNRGCTPGSFGYNAGAGYDLVTGLGSVDTYSLVLAWSGQGPKVNGPPTISSIGNGAAFNQTYAPGMILTIMGSHLAPAVHSYASVPLPTQLDGVGVTVNNINAPLYYVSPGQINLQIPYETPANTTVTLTVNNNGQTVSATFPVAAAAPGIFVDQNGAPVPFTSAARGQTITLFATGLGAVTPAVSSGGAPSAGSLPRPTQKVVVTVAGVETVSSAAIPDGYVGVAQVNYQIPTNAPLGPQSVIVSVAGIASNKATLNITQ